MKMISDEYLQKSDLDNQEISNFAENVRDIYIYIYIAYLYRNIRKYYKRKF